LEKGDRGVGEGGADGVRQMTVVHGSPNLLLAWLKINHSMVDYQPTCG
jgi:hypothetical protein